jgi:hypothetical protein
MLIAGTGLRGLRRFAIFDTTFITKITAFLRLPLRFGCLAVLVHLFLDVARTFFDFAFNTHGISPFGIRQVNERWPLSVPNARDPFAKHTGSELLSKRERDASLIDSSFRAALASGYTARGGFHAALCDIAVSNLQELLSHHLRTEMGRGSRNNSHLQLGVRVMLTGISDKGVRDSCARGGVGSAGWQFCFDGGLCCN